ncbi:MAG: lipopolysaccharide biosynthesis protein [Caulobacteraceae bacterium]|nr:lipopolysaccharide biosynthesis protein [Caulobacteraceae bacterium]
MQPFATLPSAGPQGISNIFAIDPAALLAFARRRAPLFLATAAVFFALVVGYTLQLTPRYTASADVLIDVAATKHLNIENVIAGLSSDNNTVDTQAQILSSRSLGERVVRKLNLQNDPEFNPALMVVKPGIKQRLGLSKSKQVRRLDPNSPLAFDATVSSVLSRVNVTRQGLTYIMSVRFTSLSPEKAADIANTFANEYIVDQLEAKFEATKTVNTWLNDRIGALRGDVEGSDAQLQQYKISNGLLSTQGATMAEQEVGTLDQQIAQAQADLAAAQARLATTKSQVEKGNNLQDVSAALASSTIISLRAQETDASKNLAQLKARYLDQHPLVISAKSQLDDIQTRIREEIARVVASQQAEVDVAQQRVSSLKGSLNGARGQLESNGRAQVGLAQLQRTSDANRATYEALLNKSKETAGDASIQQPDARVLSTARRGSRTFPNVLTAIVFGFVFGVFFAACAVALAEVLETGLATSQAIERKLKISHIASLSLVPRQGRKGESPEDYLVSHPLSAFAESYRSLRASVLLNATKNGRKRQVIAICSSLPGEGKTVSSICVMRTAVLARAKVVLVDTDLRRRGLSRKFEPKAVGIVEVLNGTAKLEDALVHDPLSGGYVLPAIGAPDSAEDLLGSVKMDNLLAELRSKFDLVILDTPPVLAVAEARLVAAKVDAVIFIVRWRKTPARAAEIGLGTLRSSGADVVGVALSQVNLDRQRSYGYGDGTYYYGRYSNYYQS